MDIRPGIIEAAQALGVSPNDLATIISLRNRRHLRPDAARADDPLRPAHGPDPVRRAAAAAVRRRPLQPAKRALELVSSAPTVPSSATCGRQASNPAPISSTCIQPSTPEPSARPEPSIAGRPLPQKVAGMGGHQPKATALLGGQWSPSTLTAQSAATGPTAVLTEADNPYQKMIDDFNARRRDLDEEPQQRSLLAETMASSVGRRDNSGGGLSAADQEPAPPPITDFATPAAPEALQEARAMQPPAATVPSDTLPLADIFKVAPVGVPDQDRSLHRTADDSPLTETNWVKPWLLLMLIAAMLIVYFALLSYFA